MTINEAAVGRKNNLNIIRLVAALMVLYMHSLSVSIGSQTADVVGILTQGKELAGGLAVDIFFIISGFLICRSYDRKKSVASYFWARFLRIWPLTCVVTLVCAFILGPLLTEYTYSQYMHGDILGFLKNIYFDSSNTLLPGVFNKHYNHSLNGSIWTLQYEVLCYILVALTAFVWRKFKASSVIVTIGLAVMYIMYTYLGAGDIGPLSTGFLTNFSRLAMFFAVGSVFYLYGDKIILSNKLLVISIAGLIIGTLTTDFAVTFAVFGSYIIFYIAFQKRFIATWYDKVGDLSFGVYLMAFPIQQTLVEVMGKPTEYYGTMSMNPYLNMAITLIILLPLSWLSWHFLESKCLKLKK
ncbi:MAG: acyltransferase [Pseudobutyrivibrio sp.]|nr:acyltransferase [Pseudobutyrivibrio sp.]